MTQPTPVPTKKKRSKVQLMREALGTSFEFVRGLNRPQIEADGQTLVFRLPLSPWSVNSEVHWRTKEAIHNLYGEFFDELDMQGKLPAAPTEPFSRAMVCVTYYTQRHNDFDNLFSRTKVSFDMLVQAGYLIDDGPEHLRWAEPPRQFVYSWAAPYVVIRLIPVTEFSVVVDEEPIPQNPADVLIEQKRIERELKQVEREMKKAQMETERQARAIEWVRIRDEKAAQRATEKAARLAEKEAERERKIAERLAMKALKVSATPRQRAEKEKSK